MKKIKNQDEIENAVQELKATETPAAAPTPAPARSKTVIRFHFDDGTTMAMDYAEYVKRGIEQDRKWEEIKSHVQVAIADEKWKDHARKRDKAIEQHANSDKGKAKIAVEAEWKRWREARGKGRWRAAFARKMLNNYPVLENQKSIENWAKAWEDEYAKTEK